MKKLIKMISLDANKKPINHILVSEDIALNHARAALSRLTRQEETMLDLKAMAFIQKVVNGQAMKLTNNKNNKSIVFQLSK